MVIHLTNTFITYCALLAKYNSFIHKKIMISSHRGMDTNEYWMKLNILSRYSWNFFFLNYYYYWFITNNSTNHIQKFCTNYINHVIQLSVTFSLSIIMIIIIFLKQLYYAAVEWRDNIHTILSTYPVGYRDRWFNINVYLRKTITSSYECERAIPEEEIKYM